jgi:hypothetical protein
MERILGFLPLVARLVLAVSPAHQTWVKTIAEWILRGDRRDGTPAPPPEGVPPRRLSDEIGFRVHTDDDEVPGGGS